MTEALNSEFEDILSQFGKQMGLDAPTLEDSGYTCLELENGRVIHLQFEARDLMLLTELGNVTTSGDQRQVLFEEMLAANAFWNATRGATLSYDPKSGNVLLARRIPLNWLKDDGLVDRLEEFLLAESEWSERIRADVAKMDRTLEPAAGPDQGPTPDQFV